MMKFSPKVKRINCRRHCGDIGGCDGGSHDCGISGVKGQESFMRKWKIISGTGLLLLGLLFPAAGCRQVYAEEKTSPEILEGVLLTA